MESSDQAFAHADGVEPQPAPSPTWVRLLLLLPLLGFLALAALFYAGLGAPGLGSLSPGLFARVERLYARLGDGDPSKIPSPLIGKQVPSFSLPIIARSSGSATGVLTDADLRQGHVTIVNVFASWCAPCHEEHPQLMRLARDKALAGAGLRIVGIAYKDQTAHALDFLNSEGNPYALVGADASGRAAIDWGVYGVPETFIVKGDGTIASKFIGPMSEADLSDVILPQIARAGR